ncbi:MAG: chemotaxis protein CheB [Campylobacterota bacterium]|nr:chemotaxis protein CheB [Campylobacterota bacterium]
MQDNQELINKLTQTMDKVVKAKEHEKIHTILEELLIELTHSEQSTLFLFDPQEMRLYNNNANKTQEIFVVGSAGLLGISLLSQKSMIYNHLTSQKHYDPIIDNPYQRKLKGQIIHPLMKDGEILGVIRISRTIRINRNYTQNDLALIQSMENFLIDIIDVLKSDNQVAVVEEIPKEEPKEKPISKPQERVEDEAVQRTKEAQERDAIMLFLSNTVHDIRTPANSLFGFLDLIEERIEDKQILEFISNAKESAQFINTLTDSILDRVKYTKESSESKPTVINSVKFFSQIANIFTANMFKKGIAYLSPANYHMYFDFGDKILLSTEEQVNHSRPSIDLSFLSAGYLFRDKLLAIILSGANRDGVEGMKVIQNFGGKTIVQNPVDCQVDTMTKGTLDIILPDFVLNSKNISTKIIELLSSV